MYKGIINGFVTALSSARAKGPGFNALENAVMDPFVIPLYITHNFIEAADSEIISLLQLLYNCCQPPCKCMTADF